MIKAIPRYLLSFVILVSLQILIFNNIQLGGYINPYIYILFLLILPFDTPKWSLLFIGFLLGFSIDLFSHTLGMHSSACVFMAFLRPVILKIIAPREGYESETYPTISYYGINWFLKYSIILVLAHHTFLFFVEVFRFSDFFATILRILLSTTFSLFLIIIAQYFYKKQKRR